MTYASVVSRETVRIALTVAALNDLEVKASDIQNAYLTAPCKEKIWTTLGLEFGEDAGKKAVIVRALYGLKSSGATFCQFLAQCMNHLGFTPCKADPDLWFKKMWRPGYKEPYYAYMPLYVDDCLCMAHYATAILNELDKYFMMKPGSIGDPDIYLGAKLRKVQLPSTLWPWSMSSSKYVQDLCKSVEDYIKQNFPNRMFPRKATIPWPSTT